jgi:hypothetical protein
MGRFLESMVYPRRWTSAASSLLRAGVTVPIAQAAASSLSGQMMPLPLGSVSACAMRLRSVSPSAVSIAVLLVKT